MNHQTLEICNGSRIRPGQHPVREWASLRHGDRVDVWSNNSFRYTAYVDDRTDDGRLIWLIENGTGSRRLFVHEDPVTLYPV
jgi:hypothetical protein